MFHKEDKKSCCHHGILALVIAVFLGVILIVLVFKVGMMAGGSKYKAGYSHKNFSGHIMGDKLSGLKKSGFADYKVVTELTDSGFIVKDAKGNEQTVQVNEDTVIYKGGEKGGAVSVGNKVYVEGSAVEASTVKIYDAGAKEFKK
jgi:hypothetical protein